ncbi:MAG TPA: NAD(P)/FAD-dependent oxidoreductase [Kofleriaceae bacterium]|nr:NAD(P)/FAD-dependent oxidoreductase [Kofleriaceae bacterium]
MIEARVDVVIVGGGPAGLSAALVLGRCQRSVVVLDNKRYRNADTRARVHGFITRDGTSPDEFRHLARADVARYPTVRIEEETVVDARRIERGFAVLTKSGRELQCGALLIATGFIDTVPTVAGARELHGQFVVPCPYCDAYEVRDQPLAAFSYPDDTGAHYAYLLAQWSSDVVFCAERRPQLSDEMRARLAERNVRVEDRELRSIEREGDGIRLVFSEGESLSRRILFYHLGGRGASNLPEKLGARVDERGSVDVDRKQAAIGVRGLWVAGDATRDVLQSIVAAGEGASAAVCINEFLCGGESHGKPRIPNV